MKWWLLILFSLLTLVYIYYKIARVMEHYRQRGRRPELESDPFKPQSKGKSCGIAILIVIAISIMWLWAMGQIFGFS